MVKQTVDELILELNQRGIKLWADGANLRSKSPKGQLTPVLRDSIRENKEELLRFLSQVQTDHIVIPTVPRNESLSLSFAEQRLWFIHQLEPDTPTYNIPLAYRLRGTLNTRSLEESITHLIGRHESLRTTFSKQDEQLVRVIAKQEPFVLPVMDLSALTDNEKKAEVKLQIERETNFNFDLQNGSLFRVSLLRLSDQEHVFLINMHHIISDGWSMGIFWRELRNLYDAFCENLPSPLPDLPIQYADFAHWQRNRDDILSRQLSYWKKNLQDAPLLLNLPTDHLRPSQPCSQGENVRLTLSADLTQALNSLSQQNNVTLFMTLLTVFKVLLFRYSAQEDIIIGTPIANRTMSQIEGVIGFFINALVLRSNLSGSPAFTQLLKQVRDVTLDAYQNQDMPFEKLVEELSPERTLNHHPLFQVMFVLQNTDEQHFTLPGLDVNQIQKKPQTAKFDLTLTVIEQQGALQANFNYSSDLFDASTIERMADHFQTLLEGIVANSETPISDLPLLTESERHQLLVEWNDTTMDYPRDKCIHQLFEEQVERTPDAIALVFGDEQLTYSELNNRANQLAHHFHTCGIEQGKVVGVCLPRSFDVTVTLLAIFKSGGIYLPLDPSLPNARHSLMLADAGATLVVTTASQSKNLNGGIEQVICLDSEVALLSKQPVTNLTLCSQPEEPAYIIYTSGSTGNPKGTLVPHKQLLNRLHWMWKSYPFKPDEMSCQKTALSFVDSLWELLGPLLQGSPTVILNDETVRDPVSFIAALRTYGVTRLWLVPTLLQLLLSALPKTQNQLPKLKFLAISGEILPTTLYRQFQEKMPHSSLYNLYGTSEVWDATWYKPTLDHLHLSAVPIGKPIQNVETYILDEHLQPLPVGIAGELYVGGAGLAEKYLGRPELTATKFIPHPIKPNARLYCSGDLARYLPDGNILLVGRKDNQVKIRGFRIELGEIENALNQHSEVRKAVVSVQENTDGEKQLTAYITPNDVLNPQQFFKDNRSRISSTPSLNSSQLRGYIRGKLPEFMIPNAFMLLSEFPLTPSGKINRQALPDMEAKHLPTNSVFTAPRDSLEHQLVNLWEGVLLKTPIGIHDNFFELGGHSLLAVTLFDKTQKLAGQQLPLSTLFEMPTIAQQAEHLRKNNKVSVRNSLVAVQPKGSKPPLFLVPPAGGTGLGFRKLAHHLGPDQPVYTFEPFGLDGTTLPHNSVEAVATYYIQELRDFQSDGPYRLGGMCFGCHVAWEMAYQLRHEMVVVDTLLMLDPRPPASGPSWGRAPLPRKTPKYLIQRIYHHTLQNTLSLMIRRRWRKVIALFDQRTQRFEQLRKAQNHARVNYRARSSLITMFIVQSEQYSVAPEICERWRMLTKGKVDSTVIPGSTHRSLLVEDEVHVRKLARFIQSHLSGLKPTR